MTKGHSLPLGVAPSLQVILLVVADAAGLSINDLKSPRRDQASVVARRIYYRLARRLTGSSLPEIARACGNRDHTTVLHGIRSGLVPKELMAEAQRRVAQATRRSA